MRTRLAWIAPLALALLAVFVLAQLLHFGHGKDQATFAVIGQTILDGGAPYLDAWDVKPPGIYFVYALARVCFGPGELAVRLLEALGLVSLFGAFALYARRHVGSAAGGILGALLAVLAYVPFEFWHTAQPEGFAGMALAWALVCVSYEPCAGATCTRVRQLAAWAAAGALYGCAALLKPPLGGGLLASAAILAWRHGRRAPSGRRARVAVIPCLALAGGALVPLAATLGTFAALGALPELLEAQLVFAPRYAALGLRGAEASELLWTAVRGWALLTLPFSLLGIAALLALPQVHPREREGVAHVAGAILFSILGVALQAKFFLYHQATAVLLAGLLGGMGFWKLGLRLRSSPALRAVALAVLLGLAVILVLRDPMHREFWERSLQRVRTWTDPAGRQALRDRIYSSGDMDARDNRLAAAWVEEHTPPGSTLFVWGFEPALYVLSDRRPASRYVHNQPQRSGWSAQGSRRLLMEELSRALPAAIVVVHGDPLPWVTGSALDSAEALETFPELRALLQFEYDPAERIGDLAIWRRRSP